jgi:hypothetical protein
MYDDYKRKEFSNMYPVTSTFEKAFEEGLGDAVIWDRSIDSAWKVAEWFRYMKDKMVIAEFALLCKEEKRHIRYMVASMAIGLVVGYIVGVLR